jgi:hypothetical protein
MWSKQVTFCTLAVQGLTVVAVAYLVFSSRVSTGETLWAVTMREQGGCRISGLRSVHTSYWDSR